ncbi:MAG: hypothetical protein AAF393_12400 [Pseudomonadota bacterium]
MSGKVACRTPNQDKPGVTNIPEWKFNALRAAILQELAAGDVPFSELGKRAAQHLSEEDLSNLGSVGWHVTTVKLELEVRGEIGRKSMDGKQVVTLTS